MMMMIRLFLPLLLIAGGPRGLVCSFSVPVPANSPLSNRQRQRLSGLLDMADADASLEERPLSSTSSATISTTYFDGKEECADLQDGELCVLPYCDDDDDDDDAAADDGMNGSASATTTSLPKKQTQQQQEKIMRTTTSLLDRVLFLFPILAPLFAYFSYESVASFSDVVIDILSDNKNWVTVDGGSYGATLIAPAINGVLMPACAVTFATLLSVTISALRQRQQDIRATINMEAGELRVLQAMVDSFPSGIAQDRCRTYLIQYTSRLIAESQRASSSTTTLQFDTSSTNSYAGDSEMTGFLNQLIDLKEHDVRASIQAESFSAVARLNAERSTRISALQASFPMLHYAVLSVLALSICTSFLIETNQDVLVFLNAVQLKLLWAMLVGVFSGLAVVCYDLEDPFQGSYQINQSVDQLYTIRSALRASETSSKAG